MIYFYKATRPQAPSYAKHPDLANSVECSVCRGLFLPNTDEAKTDHRLWHKEGEETRRMTCVDAAEFGLTYQHPEFGLGAVTGHNLTTASLRRCKDCGEDLHTCGSCELEHARECADWQLVRQLEDKAMWSAADTLTDRILEARNVAA